jgi:hypothetical protein
MRRPIGLSVPYRKKDGLFTPDEVLEMAKQAGFNPKWPETRAMFEAFANIVAARTKDKK